MVNRGFGWDSDVKATEADGCLKGANPDYVSDRAIQRGFGQCGTLGSGNHFAEVQVVDEVFDKQAAGVLGLAKGGITVMIHSGSRGLGHQVCEDAIRSLRGVPERLGIELPDRQLVCASAVVHFLDSGPWHGRLVDPHRRLPQWTGAGRTSPVGSHDQWSQLSVS